MFMTILEAQIFVRRWRRVLIPWPTPHNDTDSARAMERSFFGIAIGPLPPILIPAVSGSLPLSHWPLSVIIPVFAIMLFSYFLSLRFRAARRLFEEADAQHLLD